MKTLLLAATLALATYVGSAGAQNPAGPQNAMMKDCPMAVEGAEITAEDTANGIALTITTQKGNVAELRARVERMLGMHRFAAKSEAIKDGARVVLTPKDPAKLTEFRKQVRDHVAHMTKNGACQQMHEMMQGMKGMMGGMGGMDPNPHHPEAK
jgi:hypothetical protein